MVRSGVNKRSAASAQRTDGSGAETSDEGAKLGASGQAQASPTRDLTKHPVVTGNKLVTYSVDYFKEYVVTGNKVVTPPKSAAVNASAVADPKGTNPVVAVDKAPAPQQLDAVNAIVVADDNGNKKPKGTGQYDKFMLQMKQFEQGKPSSKAATPAGASPTKFGSPGKTKSKSNKVWVAGLTSGEMVAFATDRYKAEAPAYIKNGLDRLRGDPEIAEKCMVSEIIAKKADKLPFKLWAEGKISAQKSVPYTLYWFVLVRTFEDLADHTPEARSAWGISLAKYFELTDRGSKFEYGGDLSKDQACPASDFFKVQDVMEKFIMKRLSGVMVESEIVKNAALMASYYGEDPVLHDQVVEHYTPSEQQSDEEEGEEEDNLKKELCGLF
jgi:hypothetical protein